MRWKAFVLGCAELVRPPALSVGGAEARRDVDVRSRDGNGRFDLDRDVAGPRLSRSA